MLFLGLRVGVGCWSSLGKDGRVLIIDVCLQMGHVSTLGEAPAARSSGVREQHEAALVIVAVAAVVAIGVGAGIPVGIYAGWWVDILDDGVLVDAAPRLGFPAGDLGALVC